MRAGLRDEEAVEVQMAPLIDCVFLLLIFFLVATTLKKIDEELPLTLPDARAVIEVQQPDDYMVVCGKSNSARASIVSFTAWKMAGKACRFRWLSRSNGETHHAIHPERRPHGPPLLIAHTGEWR